MTMGSSIGDDKVVIVDIHGVYGMGLPLVKWGLSLSVPLNRIQGSATLGD